MKSLVEFNVNNCGDCPFCNYESSVNPIFCDGGYYCVFPGSDVNFIHYDQSKETVKWIIPDKCPLRKYEVK